MQLIAAAVGVIVGVMLLQPVKAKAAGVLTTKLTAVDAAEPELGVAVNVPEYDCATVPDVTVTVPQVAPPAHAPVGPEMVAPLIAP